MCVRVCRLRSSCCAHSRFEKILADNDGGLGWVVGDGVTYADFVLFHFTDYVINLYAPPLLRMFRECMRAVVPLPRCSVGADALVGFDLLSQHHARVLAIPAVKVYTEERPKSEW